MPSLSDEVKNNEISKLASFRDRSSRPAKAGPPDPMPGIEDVRSKPKKTMDMSPVKPELAIQTGDEPKKRGRSKKNKEETEQLVDETKTSNTQLSEIQTNTSDTNKALSKLSNQLESKLSAQPQLQSVELSDNTEAVLEDFADRLRDQNNSSTTQPDVAGSVLPNSPRPVSEPRPTEDNAADKADKAKSEKEKADVSNKMLGLVKNGFKTSKSTLDKISGMLFKYTLTAAIGAAKLAGSIFLIILAIDLLRIHFKYWSEKLMIKFDEIKETIMSYFDKIAGWTDGWMPVFDSIRNSIDYIANIFRTGDWGSLAGAIGDVVKESIKTMASLIQNAFAKIGAAILRKFGFDGAADNLEAIGLENLQNNTNKPLSEKDQKTVAKYQQKLMEQDYTPSQVGLTAFLPDTWRKKIGALSDNEYNRIQAEKKDVNIVKGMKSDDQQQWIMAQNEASTALNAYEDAAKKLDPNNSDQLNKLNASYNRAKQAVSDSDLNKTPEVKKVLTTQLETIRKQVESKKTAVKPAPASKSPEAVQANNVQRKTDALKAKPEVAAQNTAVVNNTKVSNSKTIQMQRPITSTNAPGIFGGAGVN